MYLGDIVYMIFGYELNKHDDPIHPSKCDIWVYNHCFVGRFPSSIVALLWKPPIPQSLGMEKPKCLRSISCISQLHLHNVSLELRFLTIMHNDNKMSLHFGFYVSSFRWQNQTIAKVVPVMVILCHKGEQHSINSISIAHNYHLRDI